MGSNKLSAGKSDRWAAPLGAMTEQAKDQDLVTFKAGNVEVSDMYSLLSAVNYAGVSCAS